ncbi:MAG: sigma-70 family RNA polymerase sigma factor [Rhodanobacteraceae bacterium]|nr:sigma-70 family RNA polymerase sigma factor [Rhodanobacteraceae bacterium]
MNAPPDLKLVLEQHAAMLARIARGFEAETSARQDLLQEIGLALWRALPSFRGQGSLGGFVAQVAHHVAVEHVARQRRHSSVTELSEHILDPVAGPESLASKRQGSELLFAAIRQLPLNQAEVMVLQLEGFAQHEIAGMLGVSANVVGVRSSRARERLRTLMAGQGTGRAEVGNDG